MPIKVLDVGGGGLDGENTSVMLLERYGIENVTFINRKPESVVQFMAEHPKAKMVIGDYYTHQFPELYDLVVLDLNIENNLKDWENGHARARELLSPGGSIITYVMTTTDYGDPETPALIRESMLKVWGTTDITQDVILKNLDVVAVEKEPRRSYIQWVIVR